MADKGNTVAGSVAGKYFVDTQCIDCNLCVDTAPNNFVKDENAGYSYVFKQPENAEEEAQCKESMESCPVEAIGDDGE